MRSVEEYGRLYRDCAPTWPAWLSRTASCTPGQAVSVYIKSILPDKMKIKLVVVNRNLNQPLRFEPHYFVTRGRIKRVDLFHPEKPQTD